MTGSSSTTSTVAGMCRMLPMPGGPTVRPGYDGSSCPRSSGDRAPASGAGCVGSNPTEGADRANGRISGPGRRAHLIHVLDVAAVPGWLYVVMERTDESSPSCRDRAEQLARYRS